MSIIAVYSPIPIYENRTFQTPESRFFADSKHNSFTDILLISGYIEDREKKQRIGRAYARPFSPLAGCPSVQYSLGNRIYNTKNTNKHFLFYYSTSTVWNPLFIPFSIP